MKNNNNYGNDSLSTLEEKEKVRLRPGVIFGSDGIKGAKHTVKEIIGNSRDEASEGFGNIIEVIRYNDKSIEVKDRGRGIPIEWNPKEEKYNWQIVFTILYGGGKYDNNGDSNYQFSIGLNGLGTAATQFASEYMDVTVFRDGYRYNLYFSKGDNITENDKGFIKSKCDYEQTGTIIKWKPDLEVFNNINISLDFFQDFLKRQAIVNKGITFNLYDEESNQSFTYYYEDGIKDYVKELSGSTGFTDVQYFQLETKGRDREDKPQYKVKIEIAFCFNNEVNLLEYYHNSSFLEHGGSPDDAVKNAFRYEIDQSLKSQGKYKKNEKSISFTDIEDSLILVANTFSTMTSYENQTKKAITNKFIKEVMNDFLKEKLEIYFIENKEALQEITNQILVNKRSRERAEKTRIDIRKKLSKSFDNISNKVEKFVDCRTKDKDRRELFIVEGDSALGSTKMGRDAEFQAIMPVRGKIRNCLKSDYNKIFNDDLIIDLLKVLGCGVEVKTKHENIGNFNLDDLRWNKVIICTDADYDGYQIRCLILTMLYVLTPTLIEKGHVYIAESPLYEINSDKKTYFAYSDKEKDLIIKNIKGRYHIQRSKGLGENEPDMMWKTTMNPKSRRLIKVMPTDAVETKKAFDLFLGNDLKGRKQFISEYGKEYIDLVDVM